MKTITFLLAFILVLLPVLISADRCSYEYCYKEELFPCKEAKSREQCNGSGGLYITYRERALKGSKHKCCPWTLQDAFRKRLGCVRNIRTSTKKCTSEGSDYELKVKTLDKCNTFSCQ